MKTLTLYRQDQLITWTSAAITEHVNKLAIELDIKPNKKFATKIDAVNKALKNQEAYQDKVENEAEVIEEIGEAIMNTDLSTIPELSIIPKVAKVKLTVKKQVTLGDKIADNDTAYALIQKLVSENALIERADLILLHNENSEVNMNSSAWYISQAVKRDYIEIVKIKG